MPCRALWTWTGTSSTRITHVHSHSCRPNSKQLLLLAKVTASWFASPSWQVAASWFASPSWPRFAVAPRHGGGRRQSHVKATLAGRATTARAPAAEGDTGHTWEVYSRGGAASDPSLPLHAKGAADPIRVPGGCCSRTSRALSAALAPSAHVHLAFASLPRGADPAFRPSKYPTRGTAMGRRRHG
jgi:hypothetical protein